MPSHPKLRDPTIKLLRTVESFIAIYALMIGLVFLSVPGTLDFTVYENINGSPLPLYGWALLVIFLLHSLALWWNGRNRIASRFARLVACVGHLTISVTFGVKFFNAGVYLPLPLFWFLLPGLNLLVLNRVIGEIKYLIFPVRGLHA